jgi:6-phosphogluconolactonase
VANFELIQFASADELASRVAALWLEEIESANRAGKNHSVALSGGRISQKFFAWIVAQSKARNISFENVHFFWADERCVPPTDPESNFKMANDLLFTPLKISMKQIHRIRGEEQQEEAVKIAEKEFQQFASRNSNNQPVLDLIFLGIGEDGHVASLFPNAPENFLDTTMFLAIENSPKPPPNRISLNYTAIAAAKQVWILASGSGKEFALTDSLKSNGKTPLAKVIQSRSSTKIYADIKI